MFPKKINKNKFSYINFKLMRIQENTRRTKVMERMV